jgi:hypothetical protein
MWKHPSHKSNLEPGGLEYVVATNGSFCLLCCTVKNVQTSQYIEKFFALGQQHSYLPKNLESLFEPPPSDFFELGYKKAFTHTCINK